MSGPNRFWLGCDNRCPPEGHPDGTYCRATLPAVEALKAELAGGGRPIPAPRAPEPDPTPPEPELLASLRRLAHPRSALGQVPPPAWMIEGVLSQEALALLSGKFGTYKTFVAIAWACSIATGVDWFGREVKHGGPVLYVAAEGIRGIGSRVWEWEMANYGGQRIPDDRLVVISAPVRLNRGGEVDALVALGRELGVGLVVWDTLHRCAPGVEENSNTDMGNIVNALAHVRGELHCTQLVVHHTGHAGIRSRGASNIEDDFEDSWVIQLGADPEDRSPANPRTLKHRKAKDFTLSADVGLHLAVGLDGGAVVVERTAEHEHQTEEWIVRQRIMAALDAAGVPLSAGRDRVRAVLAAAGIQIRNDDLAELVKARKATPVSPELPLGGYE